MARGSQVAAVVLGKLMPTELMLIVDLFLPDEF
jgi:hypothetical protein